MGHWFCVVSQHLVFELTDVTGIIFPPRWFVKTSKLLAVHDKAEISS